jgi:hypothetical protein
VRGARQRGRRLPIQVAIAVIACASCATRPHALDYVVLVSDGEPTPPPPGAASAPEATPGQNDYPIYGEPFAFPSGTGGTCAVGLIGEQCERGLLEDETPLEEKMLLGADGVVIEDWEQLNLPSASRPTGDRGSARRAAQPRR